jgi:hypothetical protein
MRQSSGGVRHDLAPTHDRLVGTSFMPGVKPPDCLFVPVTVAYCYGLLEIGSPINLQVVLSTDTWLFRGKIEIPSQVLIISNVKEGEKWHYINGGGAMAPRRMNGKPVPRTSERDPSGTGRQAG